MPVDPSLAALDEALEQQDTPETPEVEPPAPAEDTPEPTPPVIDWEKRHRDAAAEITRRAQLDVERDAELETLRAQVAAVQHQPPAPRYADEYDDDDDGPGYDPIADPRIQAQLARVDRLEAQLNQKVEQDTLARERHEERLHIDDELDRLEAAYKDELNEDESTWIGRAALANRDPITGKPDVEAAYSTFNKMFEGRKKQWASGKRSAPAPATGPGAVEVPDLDDPEARADYIDKLFE